MRIVELDNSAQCVSWGQQGESGTTTLVADITDFLAIDPNGTAAAIFQRKDGHPYLHKYTQEDNNIFITITSTDTQLVGKCELAISWAAGNRIAKKKNYHSFILPAALETDLPLTEDNIVALDNLTQAVEEAKNLARLETVENLPNTGLPDKLYLSTSTNGLYFWNNDAFVPTIPTNMSISGGNAVGDN